MLEPRELMALAQLLFAFERTREALDERAARGAPLTAHRPPAARCWSSWRGASDRCFEADGEISDRASPELKEARDRCAGCTGASRRRLDELLHDENFLPNLRENYYTLRNDRYVVPVMAQLPRARCPASSTTRASPGQTLFVEPRGA